MARRQAAERTQQRLADVEVEVAVRFAPLRLPSSRIGGLAVGDVVPLGSTGPRRRSPSRRPRPRSRTPSPGRPGRSSPSSSSRARDPTDRPVRPTPRPTPTQGRPMTLLRLFARARRRRRHRHVAPHRRACRGRRGPGRRARSPAPRRCELQPPVPDAAGARHARRHRDHRVPRRGRRGQGAARRRPPSSSRPSPARRSAPSSPRPRCGPRSRRSPAALGGRLDGAATGIAVEDSLDVLAGGTVVLVPLVAGGACTPWSAVSRSTPARAPAAAAAAGRAAGTDAGGAGRPPPRAASWGIDMLRDVEMEVTCELGRTRMTRPAAARARPRRRRRARPAGRLPRRPARQRHPARPRRGRRRRRGLRPADHGDRHAGRAVSARSPPTTSPCSGG